MADPTAGNPCCQEFAIPDLLSPDCVSPWRIFNPKQQKWQKHPGTESLIYLSSVVHAAQDYGQMVSLIHQLFIKMQANSCGNFSPFNTSFNFLFRRYNEKITIRIGK
jgi:hypothetical protein